MTPSRIFINIKRCKALVYKRFRCAHDAYTYFANAQQRKRQGQREKDKERKRKGQGQFICVAISFLCYAKEPHVYCLQRSGVSANC